MFCFFSMRKMQDWLLLEAFDPASVPALKTCWWARIVMLMWSPLMSRCSFDNWNCHQLSSLRQLWIFDERQMQKKSRQNIQAGPIWQKDNHFWRSNEPVVIRERETKELWSCTRSEREITGPIRHRKTGIAGLRVNPEEVHPLWKGKEDK